MVVAAASAEDIRAPKARAALAFASSFTICLLAAGALSLTLFGRAHPAGVDLEWPATAPVQKTHAPVAAPVATAAPVTPGAQVTQVIRAGSALVADPA